MNGACGISVLVVDDDPRVRAALVRLLDEQAGGRVAAVDTDQAMRLPSLITLETDVAVVDLPGPGSRGEAVIRRFVQATPVVAVSLNGAARRAALLAGAALFVEKDGDDRALMAAVLAAAGRAPGHNALNDLGSASHHREGPRRCTPN